MFLSFLIPSYNSVSTIERCIDSIIKQNTVFEYEIIVADQSCDCTRQLLQKYSDNPCFKILYLDKPSLFEARRLMFKISKGDYIWCVDSDDCIAEDCLNDIFIFLKANSPDLLIMKYYDDDKYHKNRFASKHKFSKKWYAKKLITTDIFNSLWSKIYSRRIINTVNFNLVKNVKLGDDKMFNLLFLENVNKILQYPFPTYHYLTNFNSIVHNPDVSQIFNDFIEISEFGFNFPQYKNYFKKMYAKYLIDNLLRLRKCNNLFKEEILNMYLYKIKTNKFYSKRSLLFCCRNLIELSSSINFLIYEKKA